ncbi:hypothetical protein F4819DRAFT_260925 [Hypoxylon fuscum]|nr:hypothetical protein F4819DRAFT_260925 [Hypoxylon fuscum]
MATTTTTFRKTTLSHAQKTVLAMSRAQYLDAICATRPADKLYVGVCIFRMDTHSSRPSVLLLRRSDGAASLNPISMPRRSNSRWRRHSKQHNASNRNSRDIGGICIREGEEGGEDDGNGGVDGAGEEMSKGGGGSGIWELPGGKVRDNDFCISAAVARRVAEQTGLRVVRVLGALHDIRRVNEVRILDWDDDGVNIFAGDDPENLDGATLTSSTTPTTPTNSSSGATSTNTSASNGSKNRDSRRSPLHSPQLVLRKECLQLNYAVLVQSHDELAIRSRDHEEMVWASFSRAETLPMPEELRTVVHQGLAFAGEYLF